jgi:hypothetical protein
MKTAKGGNLSNNTLMTKAKKTDKRVDAAENWNIA